jgi:spermidine synthase
VAAATEVIGTAVLPGGGELKLTLAAGYYHLVLDGVPLMSSAAHFSEEHLATIGCEEIAARADARVLVGGLGMGYTIRAALDRTAPTSRIVVAELVPEVVAWNQGPLAELAGRPLDDPRTQVEIGDVVAYLRAKPEPFDAILLDTDNGPDDFTSKGNARLYTARGLALLLNTLRPGGKLVVWSAYQCPSFTRDLKRAGFEASAVKCKSRGDKGSRHMLYVGRRPDGSSVEDRPGRAKRP